MEVRQQTVIARIRPLIEERGYDAVSVDAMAAAAGVSKATFYRIFPSKEAVRRRSCDAGVAPGQLDTRDGRETLLDAAMDIFAAQGYAGATVDEIAQAAGMSKAGFYWHFESKEAIFAAIIARYAPFARSSSIITRGRSGGRGARTHPYPRPDGNCHRRDAALHALSDDHARSIPEPGRWARLRAQCPRCRAADRRGISDAADGGGPHPPNAPGARASNP